MAATREDRDLIYGGGGYVRQVKYYENKDRVSEFTIPDELAPHHIYFQGSWWVGPESASHGSTNEFFEDYLALVYSATTVNAVLTSDSGEP